MLKDEDEDADEERKKNLGGEDGGICIFFDGKPRPSNYYTFSTLWVKMLIDGHSRVTPCTILVLIPSSQSSSLTYMKQISPAYPQPCLNHHPNSSHTSGRNP
jgi:hypothetical protein